MTLGPINRQPSGLLSMLDLQTFGRVPSNVDEIVQSVIDSTEFYLQNLFVAYDFSSISFGGASLGSFIGMGATTPALPLNAANIVTVPTNEIWVMDTWSVAAQVTTAGDRVAFTLCQQIVSGVNVRGLLPAYDIQSGTNISMAISNLARRVYLGPATSLGLFIREYNVAGGGPGSYSGGRIARLRF